MFEADPTNPYPPGVPFWVAQLGPDIDAARDFYAAVFGWTFDNIAARDDPPFLVADRNGKRLASLAGPVQPAVWITAVSVGHLDVAIRLAAQTGGSAPGPAVQIPTLGRFHKLIDPAGAEIHVVEAVGRRGALDHDEPGSLRLTSLGVADPSSVAPFYEALFGWQLEAAGLGHVFRLPGYVSGEVDRPLARDVVATAQVAAGSEAAWTPDFWVTDVDAAAATAAARGGAVITAPEAMHAGVRTAVLRDPGGGRFSVTQRVPD